MAQLWLSWQETNDEYYQDRFGSLCPEAVLISRHQDRLRTSGNLTASDIRTEKLCTLSGPDIISTARATHKESVAAIARRKWSPYKIIRLYFSDIFTKIQSKYAAGKLSVKQ